MLRYRIRVDGLDQEVIKERLSKELPRSVVSNVHVFSEGGNAVFTADVETSNRVSGKRLKDILHEAKVTIWKY